ncbi:hypothetical protein [Methanobrevibacter sp.]
MMENFDRLVISLLDSDAMKGCFKKELSLILNIPMNSIDDIWLESELVDGVVCQILKVSFNNVEINKESLFKLPFKSIYMNTLIFEVGDMFL